MIGIPRSGLQRERHVTRDMGGIATQSNVDLLVTPAVGFGQRNLQLKHIAEVGRSARDVRAWSPSGRVLTAHCWPGSAVRVSLWGLRLPRPLGPALLYQHTAQKPARCRSLAVCDEGATHRHLLCPWPFDPHFVVQVVHLKPPRAVIFLLVCGAPRGPEPTAMNAVTNHGGAAFTL